MNNVAIFSSDMSKCSFEVCSLLPVFHGLKNIHLTRLTSVAVTHKDYRS